MVPQGRQEKNKIIKLPLEPLGLHRQQVLDVCTASKDTLQVDPPPLDIYPDIKKCHDTVQLIFPAKGIFLKHLKFEHCINIHFNIIKYLTTNNY